MFIRRHWLLILLLVMLTALQYRLWVGPGSWAEVASLKREIEQHQVHNERLQQRNEQLYSEVESLREEMESLEERARSELGLVGEGETFYLIIDDETSK